MIPSLPRATLARMTTRMIDRMDELDGDADSEPDGDELDGSCSADDPDFRSIYSDGDPGDPDDSEEGDDDAAEEGRPPEGALKSREAHRRRIRRTRCRAVGKMLPTYLGDGFDVHRYELLEEPAVPTLRVLRRRHRILKRRNRPR